MEKPDFGTKLIDIRKAKGLTQEEVAEKCNINVRTIQRIESGAVTPRAYTVKIISEALGFVFFETSDTGYEVNGENQHSTQEEKTIIWYLKDLFDFKTNAMRKISILASTTVLVVTSAFIINSNVLAQTTTAKKSIATYQNNDKSVKRIEVRFSTQLTYDSLVYIKNALKAYGVNVNYKSIEFDESDRLSKIGCTASSSVGSGEFAVTFKDSKRVVGIVCDFSKETKSQFCVGACEFQ